MLQSVGGRGFFLPNRENWEEDRGTLVCDATGERICLFGPLWAPGWSTGTKAIRRVIFYISGCAYGGASNWKVGLYDMSASALGPTGTPQWVQIPNASARTGWLRSDVLSADRTVSPGDMIGVVIEFDGSRGGSDSMTVYSGYGYAYSLTLSNSCNTLMDPATGVWAVQDRNPMVIFECDDGTTFLGLDSGVVGYLSSGVTITSTGGYGNDFTVNAPMAVDGLYALVGGAGTGEAFDLNLYQGNTVIAAANFDGDQLVATTLRTVSKPIPLTVLRPGVAYHVGVVPTSGTMYGYYTLTYSAATAALFPAGAAWKYNTVAISGGTHTWSDSPTATSQALVGVRVAQIEGGNRGRGVLTGGRQL